MHGGGMEGKLSHWKASILASRHVPSAIHPQGLRRWRASILASRTMRLEENFWLGGSLALQAGRTSGEPPRAPFPLSAGVRRPSFVNKGRDGGFPTSKFISSIFFFFYLLCFF